MTETRAVSIEDVRTLVAERQRYDDWLTALEARRAETPSRVFDRVHGDYSTRRSGVMEQLRSHIGTLAALGDDLDAKLGELEANLASLEDERVEAMLRTAVGEFDADRWELVRQEVEAKIAELNAERSTLLVEVDDVRTLLSSARSEPASPEPQPVVVPPEPVAQADGVDAPAARVDAPGDAPGHASGSVVEETSAGDVTSEPLDLEDALSVFAPTSVGADSPDAAASRQADARSFVDTSGIEVIDSSPIGAPAGGASALQDAPARTATLTPPGTSTSQGAAPAGHAPNASDPFDDLAFLRSVIDPAEGASAARAGVPTAAPASASTEPQKTLRCTECGTMNFPTEWYCERCGGELAAF